MDFPRLKLFGSFCPHWPSAAASIEQRVALERRHLEASSCQPRKESRQGLSSILTYMWFPLDSRPTHLQTHTNTHCSSTYTIAVHTSQHILPSRYTQSYQAHPARKAHHPITDCKDHMLTHLKISAAHPNPQSHYPHCSPKPPNHTTQEHLLCPPQHIRHVCHGPIPTHTLSAAPPPP